MACLLPYNVVFKEIEERVLLLHKFKNNSPSGRYHEVSLAIFPPGMQVGTIVFYEPSPTPGTNTAHED